MRYLFPLFTLLLIFTSIQCKNKAVTDPLLLEASEIQHEAIHIGEELEMALTQALASDTTAAGQDKYNTIMEALNDWKKNMIEIPGIEHDHNHNHGHHDHSHSTSDAASHLTPEEMKSVQTEWKNAVLALKEVL
jgi:hypothetical protein